MNCIEAKYLLPLYASNELDAKVMAEFELHTQQCAVCAREAEQLSLYDNVLRGAFAAQPLDAHGLRARVWHQVCSPERRPKPLAGRPVIRLMAAAAIIIITIVVGIIYHVTQLTSGTVYASAVDDHVEEVVQGARIEGWREAATGMEAFVREQLGDTDIIDGLAPPDYRLRRARICGLLDKQYVHLVYKNEAREISFYVRRNDAELPGAPLETVNGCALHAASVAGFEVAGFQSRRYTILVVSDLPYTESLRIARPAAQKVG